MNAHDEQNAPPPDAGDTPNAKTGAAGTDWRAAVAESPDAYLPPPDPSLTETFDADVVLVCSSPAEGDVLAGSLVTARPICYGSFAGHLGLLSTGQKAAIIAGGTPGPDAVHAAALQARRLCRVPREDPDAGEMDRPAPLFVYFGRATVADAETNALETPLMGVESARRLPMPDVVLSLDDAPAEDPAVSTETYAPDDSLLRLFREGDLPTTRLTCPRHELDTPLALEWALRHAGKKTAFDLNLVAFIEALRRPGVDLIACRPLDAPTTSTAERPDDPPIEWGAFVAPQPPHDVWPLELPYPRCSRDARREIEERLTEAAQRLFLFLDVWLNKR